MSCNVCSGNDVERSGPDLYHVKRTIDHLSHDPNAHMYQVHLCGTFTNIKAATKAVYSALGHPKESFSSLESKQDCPHGQKWPYREAVCLRARAESGEVFTVEIETEPNIAHLTSDASGAVRGPLCHVLQQLIHYSEDRDGCDRETIVQGTFRSKQAARNCAESVLLRDGTDRKDYVEYIAQDGNKDSPYGSDVIAHAITQKGDNLIVSVVETNHNGEDYYGDN
jgi:hypothetical protein